jgi:hypothetical protein
MPGIIYKIIICEDEVAQSFMLLCMDEIREDLKAQGLWEAAKLAMVSVIDLLEPFGVDMIDDLFSITFDGVKQKDEQYADALDRSLSILKPFYMATV